MKFFIVFTCALAAASAHSAHSAGLIAPIATVIGGPQHLPVIGPNGVPIDTPAVQQARAAHLAHKVDAHARNGDLAIGIAHAAPLAYASHAIAPIATVIGGPQHLPVIGPNGVPIDTPAVQQARAAHLAHKVDAHARNGDLAIGIAHAAPLAYASHHQYHHAFAAPVIAAHVGIPETPEVIAAKHVQFAAHADALARNGHISGIHHILRRGIIAVAPIAYAAQHLPVIGPNGVPVDTIEVQAARAAHLAHKVEAHARNGDLAVVAHSAPLAYASHDLVAHASHGHIDALVAHTVPAAYPTTLGVPAVTANGIPLETPEVVAAKSNHFAAHAKALARNSPIYSEAVSVIAAPIATTW